MRNFFWEGHKGSKINHLLKWNLVTRSQSEGGLGFGGLKSKNVALLAKCGWRYFSEADSCGVRLSEVSMAKMLAIGTLLTGQILVFVALG